MKPFNKVFLVMTSGIICQATFAQEWHAGDSLNTTPQDTSRINQFRNNELDYTGQELVDASFPNSIPVFGTKARIGFGGYVKVDYIQDFNGGYDRYQYEIQTVPVPGSLDAFIQN